MCRERHHPRGRGTSGCKDPDSVSKKSWDGGVAGAKGRGGERRVPRRRRGLSRRSRETTLKKKINGDLRKEDFAYSPITGTEFLLSPHRIFPECGDIIICDQTDIGNASSKVPPFQTLFKDPRCSSTNGQRGHVLKRGHVLNHTQQQ